MKNRINADCRCTTAGCKRHGDCDECRKYHREQKTLTFCKREPEKTTGGR